MILPVEGYPVSAEAIREWFRRTYGREASELEVGEIQDMLARRESEASGRSKLGTGLSRMIGWPLRPAGLGFAQRHGGAAFFADNALSRGAAIAYYTVFRSRRCC